MSKTLIVLAIIAAVALTQTCPTNQGTSCGTCRQIANCSTCSYSNNNLLCSACFNGLSPNALSSACVDCKEATGEYYCTSCAYDATLVRSKCTSCAAGYGLNTVNQCVQCNIANCGGCSVDADSVQTCSMCMTGYFASTDKKTCTACLANCKTCSDTTTCTTCNAKFWLATDSKSCTAQNIANCAIYSTTVGQCQTCNAGFFVAADKLSCTACTANCIACTSADTCTTCAAKYWGDGTAKCTAQNIANCATYSKTAAECTFCNAGYFVAADKLSCTSCIANCDVCADTTTCTTCKAKYWGNGQKACTAEAIPNCLVFSQTDGTCTTCNPVGFYKATDSKSCPACTANCVSCTSADTCTTCAPKYWGNGKATCTACSIANCDQCAQTDGATCSVCSTGYYGAGKATCTACDVANCLTCPVEKQCTSCAAGYKPSLNNGDVCISCSNVIPGCWTCAWSGDYTSNTLVCQTCQTGYTLVNQVCVPCPVGCSNCTMTTYNSASMVLNDQVLAVNAGSSFMAYSATLKCDACMSGYATVANNNNVVYCSKSSSSYLVFVFVQLLLVAFLLF